MKAAERQLRIRQMLETRDFVDLETLCRELDASESSVRRDLDMLEEEKVLRRVYGGAVSTETPPARAFDYNVETERLSTEKDRIARVAAGLIEPGQTVRTLDQVAAHCYQFPSNCRKPGDTAQH
jgi:DeoR/GlpR family transcriptional regulator of sugar metabolism